MARRPDSPYTTEQECPYPEGFGRYGEVCWMAQNEGRQVTSLGLHFNDLDQSEEYSE